MDSVAKTSNISDSSEPTTSNETPQTLKRTRNSAEGSGTSGIHNTSTDTSFDGQKESPARTKKKTKKTTPESKKFLKSVQDYTNYVSEAYADGPHDVNRLKKYEAVITSAIGNLDNERESLRNVIYKTEMATSHPRKAFSWLEFKHRAEAVATCFARIFDIERNTLPYSSIVKAAIKEVWEQEFPPQKNAQKMLETAVIKLTETIHLKWYKVNSPQTTDNQQSQPNDQQ